MNNTTNFFDEDGNLINTAWGLKKQQQEAEEEKKRQEQEKQKAHRELSRRVAIDNIQSEFFEEHEKMLIKRAVREEWMSMPSWVKRLPRPKMSDPPTVGAKEKMLTKMTGKTHLTPEEEAHRKKQLLRVKWAVEDYKSISRLIDKTILSPIPIIGVGRECGTTAVTRCVAHALADSRPDTDYLICADFGERNNDFSSWFNKSRNEEIFLKHVFTWIRDKGDELFDKGLLPSTGDGKQRFISNHAVPSRRASITTENIVNFYMSIKDGTGFFLMDNSVDEMDGVISGLAMSTTPIFVLPLSPDAPQNLSSIVRSTKNVLNDNRYHDIINRAIIVVVSPTPELDSAKNRKNIASFMAKAADEAGIVSERYVHIPYDKELSSPQMNWRKVSFATAHNVRKICTMIVDDVAVE